MDLRGMKFHPLKTYPNQKFCSIPIFNNTKTVAVRNFEVRTRNDFAKVAEGKQADRQAQFLHRTGYCARYVSLQPRGPRAAIASLFLLCNLHIGRDACT
jgi:hypothetical protein